jgi:Rrf2 family transcriptional regulator, nitric oxide-sensitive transcriptional repressor
MKLNKASLLALIAVLELASDPERQLSTTDIAEKYDISTHHLAKVMRNLVHEGMVQAMRGVGGGYRFAGNINRTTLLDIIQLFETLESELDLPHWSKAADPIVSELQCITNEIDDLTKAVLDTINLATALKNTRLRADLNAKNNLSDSIET